MGDVALSFEAPEVDQASGLDDAPDTSLEQTPETPQADAEPTDDTESSDQATSGKQLFTDGKMDPGIKSILQKLKTDDPKAAPKITALYQLAAVGDQLNREFPGGFKAVASMQQLFSSISPERGVEGVVDEINGFREFDHQLMEGDPKALDMIFDTPGGPDALAKLFPLAVDKLADGNPAQFVKLAEATIDRYAQAHPQGYAAWIARDFQQDLVKMDIPMTVQLIGHLLGRAQLSEPDKAEATTLWGGLNQYLARIKQYASTEVKPPDAKAAPVIDARAADLDKREGTLRHTEYQTAADQQGNKIFNENWGRLVAPALAAVKDTKERARLQSSVRNLYGIHHQQVIKSKGDFDSQMQRYYDAKQKDGFLRLHESTFKESIPLALRKAMAEAGLGTKKIAPVQQAQTQAGKPAAKAAQPVASGFTRVPNKPDFTKEVNRVLTTPDMWAKRQAVLKSGKRITWA